MRRLLIVAAFAVLSSAFAFASQASLTSVKATHYHRDKRVTRHRAHKATKHRAPKHHHRTV